MTHSNTSTDAGQILAQLFEEEFEHAPETVDPLPVSGSDRQYYKLKSDKKTVIGTYNPNAPENNTFFYFTNLFHKHQINVPEVIKTGRDRRYYLQQYLGGTSLFDMLMSEGYTDKVKAYFHKSLKQLARLQWIAGRETDFNQCFASRQFDEKAIMADLLYFKYYFADLQKVHYDKNALLDEMEMLSRELGRIQPQTLMFRDFQSRNIMIHNDDVFFIDYQGSMQGPPQYDIASLLWQAKAQLPASWKEELLNGYFTSLNELQISRVDEIHFRKGYSQFVLLRILQVLGAYGFRGLIEKKPHFIGSISFGLKNLEEFLSINPHLPAYQELRGLLEKLSAPEIQQRYALPTRSETSKLTVQVNSFSYKKGGIPKDKSTHGGGYVFDCRGLLNPGRYKAYKHLSGKDEPVKTFLEKETKMPSFLQNVFELISINIEDYMNRGFDHLSISFGCTGGQHRSVYSAEKTAAFIRKQFGVAVELSHLNEKNWVKEEENNLS